jgi:hypothetical protein
LLSLKEKIKWEKKYVFLNSSFEGNNNLFSQCHLGKKYGFCFERRLYTISGKDRYIFDIKVAIRKVEENA